MKRTLSLVFAVLVLSLAAFAQAPIQTFSFNASPISLPGNRQTVVASVAGMTFTPTPKLDLREDNLLAPADNFQGFFGGFNYRLPVLSTKFNNVSPNLSGARFQFYLTGSAGVDRITNANAQHMAFLAGGGLNYDLTGSGRWTMGAEVRYAKLPGLQNNTAVVTLPFSFHF